MAVNTQEFKIRISVEDDASDNVKKVAQSAAEHSGVLEKLGISSVFLNQTLELTKKVYETLAEPIREAIHAYTAQESAVTKLAASLRLVGQETPEHVKHFQEFAHTLEETSNVSEETTLNLVAMGKAMGLSDKQTEEFIQTSANLAPLFDRDISQAFRGLTGMLGGMRGKLQQMYPELAKFTDAELRSGKAAEFLSQKTKGFAEDAAKSLDGAFKRTANATEEFYKQLGKSIDSLVGIKDILTSRAEMFKKFKDVLVEIEPKIKAVGEAFRNIDWKKIEGGILSLAAAIVIFKAALFTTQLVQAVIAIGGLSSAIAAMGGVMGILSQIALFFKGIAIAAWEALIPLAPFIAAAVGIAALAASIQILYLNFGHLNDVLAVLADSAQIVYKSFSLAFTQISLLIQETERAFLGFVEKTTGADFDLKNLDKGITDAKAKIKTIGVDASKLFDTLKADAKKVDFGAAGEGAKLLNGILKGITAETKAATGANKGYDDSGRGPIANVQEQLKLIQQLKDQNLGLSTDIKNFGATQQEQIQNNLDLELQRLAIKKQQLAIEGKLAGAQGAGIKAELAKTEELMKAKAAKQTDAANNPNSINPDQLKAISGAMGEGAGDAAKAIGSATGSMAGLMSGVGAVMGAVNGVLDFVQQVLDFIPQVLSKVANIFNTLTDLPNKILAGFNDVFKSILKFITDFIPNLLNMIPELLNSIVDFLVEGLPKAIETLLERLPDIIMSLLERLPEIIEKLVSGLITLMPRVMIAIIEFLIKNGPKIAFAIMKTIYIELPKAIINGLIEGAKALINMLKNFFSGSGFSVPSGITDIPKKLEKAANDFGKRISKDASQLFQVKELTDGIKSATDVSTLTDAAQKASEAIGKRFKNLWQMLKDAWQWIYDKILAPIINGLKAVWTWVYDHVIKPYVEAIQKVWRWVWDNIYAPMLNAWVQMWTWVYDTILKPFIDGLYAVFTWINNLLQSFLNGVRNVFQNIFGGLYRAITGAFQAIFGALYNTIAGAFQSVFGGIWNSITGAFESIFGGLRQAIISPLYEIFSGAGQAWNVLVKAGNEIGAAFMRPVQDLKDFLNQFKFQNPFDGGGGNGNILTNGSLDPTTWSLGGMIPSYKSLGGPIYPTSKATTYAAQGLFVPRGGDTVPVMAQPGEVLISSGPAQRNMGLLRDINKGRDIQAGGTVVIENISINTSSKADADMIRRELLPELERSLKRKSQNGEFVIDKNGIR